LKDKTVLDKMKTYAIYIAGGHGHKLQKYPEEAPMFFVAGSPEYYDLDENPALKTAIIFDTETKEHKVLAQSPRNCIKRTVTLQAANPEQFREEFTQFLSSIEITAEDIVIIEVKTSAADFVPDIRAMEKIIFDKGALHAEIKWKRDNLNSKVFSEKRNSVEEIELEQIKKWKLWSNVAEVAVKAISEMKKSVKDGQQDISSIFDSALNSVIEGKNENK
jgi:DNA repair exonuclease SbcCD nuclease subunit